MATKLSSVELEDEGGLVEYMLEHCKRKRGAACRIMPAGVSMPTSFVSEMNNIYNMDIRPDDTWVITFPKCGTTWTQEMVWLIGNNCDFDKAKQLDLDTRCPFLELNAIGSPKRSDQTTFEIAVEMKSPRFIKSHLPVHLLPHKLWTVKPKIIYTARHPLATALSYYHHYRIFNGYDGDLQHFFHFFLKDLIDYGPFWTHVLQFWNMRKETNILFLTFEQMKDDLLSVVRRVAAFLDAKLTADQEPQLVQHLSFSSMKENPQVNKTKFVQHITKNDGADHVFIRKGEKDEWKNSVSQEFIDKFNLWTKKYKEGTDFPFY